MKKINYTRIKIIEKDTPQKAEYEINDFIERCGQNDITIYEITDHVSCDAEGYYSYTFIVKYTKL